MPDDVLRFHVSVDHRALLHLYEYQRYEDAWETPVAVSQLGLKRALSIRQAHVSRATKKLKKKGWIYERLAHVEGQSRRRKVYFLTDEGLDYTRTMRDDLKTKQIIVQHRDGAKLALRLEALRERYGQDYSLAELVERVNRKRVITAEELCGSRAASPEVASDRSTNTSCVDGGSNGGSNGASMIEVADGRAAASGIDANAGPFPPIDALQPEPPTPSFYGRTRERAQIHDWLRSRTHTHIVVYGIAGIGKTTLARKIAEECADIVPVMYYQIKKWDTPRALLRNLAVFFSHHHRPRLERALNSSTTLDWGPVTAALRATLRHLRAMIVIDDCQRLENGTRLFQSSYGAARVGPRELRQNDQSQTPSANAEGMGEGDADADTSAGQRIIPFTKFLLLSRFEPDFYDLRDVKLRKGVGRLPLQGLDPESCRQLGGAPQLSERRFRRIYRLTNGHPLAFELLEDRPTPERAVADDFLQFLESEIYATLASAERTLLERLVTFRSPVAPRALLAIDGVTNEQLESMLRRALIKRTVAGRYETHDLIAQLIRSRITPTGAKKHHHAAAAYYRSVFGPTGHAPGKRGSKTLVEAFYHLVEAEQYDAAKEIATEHGRHLVPHADAGLCTSFQRLLDHTESAADDPATRSRLLALAGDLYAQLGKVDDAIGFYERYLDTYLRSTPDRSDEDARERRPHRLGAIYNNLATLSAAKKEWDRALYLYGKSLELAQQRGDHRGVARAHNNRGIVYRAMGRYDRALDAYEEALATVRPKGDRRALAITTANIGSALEAAGRSAEAKAAYEEALEYAERAAFAPAIVAASHHLARCSLAHNDPERAMLYLDRAAAVGARADLDEQMIECELLKGEVHEHCNVRTPAKGAYRRVLERIEAHLRHPSASAQRVEGTDETLFGTRPEMGAATMRFDVSDTPIPTARGRSGPNMETAARSRGGAFAQDREHLRHYRRALQRLLSLEERDGSEEEVGELLERSAAVFLRTGHPTLAAQHLLKRGTLAIRSGDLKRALRSFLDAEKHLRAVNEPFGVAMANQNIGYIFELRKEYPRAKERYQTAIALYRSLGDKKWLARAMRDCGHCLQAAGVPDEAEAYLDAADELFSTLERGEGDPDIDVDLDTGTDTCNGADTNNNINTNINTKTNTSSNSGTDTNSNTATDTHLNSNSNTGID